MSIRAEFIGGPKDGDWIALPDATTPLRVALPRRQTAFPYDEDALPSMEYSYVELRPELTRRGWILRWHELGKAN